MKTNNKFLALLRGINVGGNNIIKKEELQTCFESLGYTHVRTYIQSGNILFMTNASSAARLVNDIEKALSRRFSYHGHSVVLSQREYEDSIASAPTSWGTDTTQKHNVLFTLPSTTPNEVFETVSANIKQHEVITQGNHAVFWSISKQHATKTSYMKLPSMPVYKHVTIRNSNTAYKLKQLFEEL